MTETKKVPQLPTDPMGVFGEPQNPSTKTNESTKSRAIFAQEAAFKRHAEVIENIDVQQTFCQEFTNQMHWLVLSEAIPISLGIHPRDTADINIANIQTFNDTKARVKTAAGESLNLINPNDQPALWRIKPADFVQWMTSQEIKPIPTLVEIFLTQPASVLSSTDSPTKTEQIVSAALAILANYPGQCSDNTGKVSADAIYNVMHDKVNTYFTGDTLPLDKKTIIEHLKKVISVI